MIIIKGIIVVHYLPGVIATLVITAGEARVPGKPRKLDWPAGSLAGRSQVVPLRRGDTAPHDHQPNDLLERPWEEGHVDPRFRND